MAEAMTVETIVEADWQMQGFWTKLRFPFKTAGGGWSDIDVLAYNPESRELVIGESKVRGPKKDIYAFTTDTQRKYRDILKYDDSNYFQFLKHIGSIIKDGIIFKNFRRMVRRVTIQLVSNYFIADDVMPDSKKTILTNVKNKIPKGIRVDIRLETTLDVICRIIQTENEHPQGRRYGHPVIDIAREINRYMHPSIKSAGRSKESTERVRKSLSGKLFASFR